MSYRKTLILLTLTGMLLISVTAIHSQQPTMNQNTVAGIVTTLPVSSGVKSTPTVDDVCDQRLAKTLAQLDAADIQIKSRDEQIVNKNEAIALQEKRFVEILGILKEYAVLDNKAKKGFWKKVGEKLGKFVDALTDPATIREILLVITVIQAGKD